MFALALAAGCGPSEREIWGAVRLFAWLPYLFGLLALRLVFASWPRSQAFVWSGAVAAALSVAPAIAGLASPTLQEAGGLGILLWCWGGLGGLGPMVVLIIFLVEASYAAGYARTAAEAAGS